MDKMFLSLLLDESSDVVLLLIVATVKKDTIRFFICINETKGKQWLVIYPSLNPDHSLRIPGRICQDPAKFNSESCFKSLHFPCYRIFQGQTGFYSRFLQVPFQIILLTYDPIQVLDKNNRKDHIKISSGFYSDPFDKFISGFF